MVIGGAIVVWAIVVMLTCAVCISAARADESSGDGADLQPAEVEPVGAPTPATPNLIA